MTVRLRTRALESYPKACYTQVTISNGIRSPKIICSKGKYLKISSNRKLFFGSSILEYFTYDIINFIKILKLIFYWYFIAYFIQIYKVE